MNIIIFGLLSGQFLTGGLESRAPFYIPCEFTSVPIDAGNTNPWGIDPERTTLITSGL